MLAVPDILFWTPPHTFEKSAIRGSDSGLRTSPARFLRSFQTRINQINAAGKRKDRIHEMVSLA
jgi:hypothetical protein